MGACGAAIHVARNLGIAFADIKAKAAGDNPQLLADAIHDLKPDVKAKDEARKAEKQADRDLWNAKIFVE